MSSPEAGCAWHRVALNAHLLAGRASYRSAGIHHYIANLLPHLPKADPNFRYTVFVGREAGQPNLPGAAIQRSAWPTARPLARILWEQFAQPLALWRCRPDLLHSLAFVSPVLSVCPAIVTVYDLSFRLMSQRFAQRPAQRLYLSTFTAYSCRRARRVIAISESTKADVVRLFNVSANKVDVARPGVDAVFRPWPAAEVEAFRARKGLPEKFILYLGTLEPRKNLAVLIRAFARLRASASQLKLILAGAKGWLYEDLFRLVQELELTDSVFFPGYVPAEELVGWYNAAAVFAYPSSYEGFGMPVLEALACGRPVVTSNVSSLPEAGGDAALSVPPDDDEALAEALIQALAFSPERRQRGLSHAAHFTWANTAAQTVASYRRALSPLPLSGISDGGKRMGVS
jgi:glycosyltransferase involved in cell wall biosynthesis